MLIVLQYRVSRRLLKGAGLDRSLLSIGREGLVLARVWLSRLLCVHVFGYGDIVNCVYYVP